jgi:hypothetical protein
MLVLRDAHDHARATARRDATFVEADPRAKMAELARAFPGALREIDRLPREIIESRIESLRAVERAERPLERWMEAQALFHRLARGALVTKRWLGRRREVTEELHAAFVAALPELGPDAAIFVATADLALVATPPFGRVTEVVHAKVGEALGVTADEARALVFSFSLDDED